MSVVAVPCTMNTNHVSSLPCGYLRNAQICPMQYVFAHLLNYSGHKTDFKRQRRKKKGFLKVLFSNDLDITLWQHLKNKQKEVAFKLTRSNMSVL